MVLQNRGNQDGYAGGYNGQNYNNYLDGYNVISASSGSNVINGIGTAFEVDFSGVTKQYNPPLQAVDHDGILQHISSMFMSIKRSCF